MYICMCMFMVTSILLLRVVSATAKLTYIVKVDSSLGLASYGIDTIFNIVSMVMGGAP